jgi:hypothetical protein
MIRRQKLVRWANTERPINRRQAKQGRESLEWRWFVLGCILLLLAVVLGIWGFQIKNLSPDQRSILKWTLSLASGFSAGAFTGSLVVRWHLIPNVVISASAGCAVWCLTFFFLYPKLAQDVVAPDEGITIDELIQRLHYRRSAVPTSFLPGEIWRFAPNRNPKKSATGPNAST